MKAQRHTAPRVEPAEPKDAAAYADLLSMAHDEGLKSIQTQLVTEPTEGNGRLCIVKATVEVERGHFEGLGDADPGNVEEFLVPHLIRVAETRAKARALRDAVNVGVVSFEELDGVSRTRTSSPGSGAPPATPRRAPRRASPPTRAPNRSNGTDGPMSEAQRRYLFRLLAGQGYQGSAAEDFLRERLGVQQIARASRSAASALIDELLQAAAPGNGGGGNGADARHFG
jgi:hypothetical protein